MIAENIDAMRQWQRKRQRLCKLYCVVLVMQCLKMNNEILPITLSLTHLHNVLLYTYFRKKNRRRWWVRNINQQRTQQGIYNNMLKELYFTDKEQFFEYTRMNTRQLDYLLSLAQCCKRKV